MSFRLGDIVSAEEKDDSDISLMLFGDFKDVFVLGSLEWPLIRLFRFVWIMVMRLSSDLCVLFISGLAGGGIISSRFTLVRPAKAISCSTTSSNTSCAKFWTLFFT